jgi:hypothetical protein
MLFEDPLQTISIKLPAGWTYNPFDSSLTDFYFTRWDQPANLIGVHVRPASLPPEQPDEQWVEKIHSEVGARASLTEMSIGTGCAVSADFSSVKGSVQRVVFMRGPQVELVIEQRGSGPELKNRWTPLEQAVQTAFSTVNLKVPEKRGPNEFNQSIESANKAFEKKEFPAVVDALQQAVNVGTSAWLHSLVPAVRSPEIHAAVRVAQAMLHISNLTGSLPMHRSAESVLRRAMRTLESVEPMSETQQLMTELSEVLHQIDSEVLEETEERSAVSLIFAMRERSFRLAQAATQAFESSDLENAYSLSGMAVEDLLSLFAFFRQNQSQDVPEEVASQLSSQGITDPAAQRETAQKAREALLLPPLNLSLQIRYCCALERTDGSALEETGILVSLSDLIYSTNTGSIGIILGRALSLMDHAAALALAEKNEYLSEAEQCLERAAQLLESITEARAADNVWIRYHGRQIDGSLWAIDQRLIAMREGKDSAAEARLLDFRSQLETVARQFREKKDQSSRAGDPQS